MARRKRGCDRIRVGKVTLYQHHGAWWLYFSEGKQRVRRKVGESQCEAEVLAAQTNFQLAQGAPTVFSFQPVSVAELRQRFLDYHEHVMKSSVATLDRYRSATQHLEDFVRTQTKEPQAHEVRPDTFARHLRQIEVAANGHKNTKRRKLRDKGVQFILETCRSMYNFALKRRHLPPYTGNPFSELPLDRLKIEDAKPIFVFTEATELAFLKEASAWAFSIHFTLAKTGLRIGELTHLLIEDVDLDGGWIYVRNKTELGWRIKTGQERTVPLLPEVVIVLRVVIGRRTTGPVFIRQKLVGHYPKLVGDRAELGCVLQKRIESRRSDSRVMGRAEIQGVARTVWWDAGVVKSDAVRISFLRTTEAIGRGDSTCPKSWRHSYATLLQDANVDPLIRQQVMGHRPTASTGLGMTGKYTHTRPETLREQVEQALRRWPASLQWAMEWAGAIGGSIASNTEKKMDRGFMGRGG
jgi:integrase